MTMQKVRIKQLKNNRLAMIKVLSRKHRSRVETAVNSFWTLRDKPDFVRELESERECLRAEIAIITIKEFGKKKSNSSVLIAEKLKRIDTITKQLNKRKINV